MVKVASNASAKQTTFAVVLVAELQSAVVVVVVSVVEVLSVVVDDVLPLSFLQEKKIIIASRLKKIVRIFMFIVFGEGKRLFIWYLDRTNIYRQGLAFQGGNGANEGISVVNDGGECDQDLKASKKAAS